MSLDDAAIGEDYLSHHGKHPSTPQRALLDSKGLMPSHDSFRGPGMCKSCRVQVFLSVVAAVGLKREFLPLTVKKTSHGSLICAMQSVSRSCR